VELYKEHGLYQGSVPEILGLLREDKADSTLPIDTRKIYIAAIPY
jgi:hypothetical protein